MTPIERLAKIVFTTTGKSIRPGELEVRNVQPNTNTDISRNTECLLIARENGRLKGSMQFYYNRLNLNTLFHNQNVTLALTFGSRISTNTLAGMIGERFGVDLLPEDVVGSGEYYLNVFPFNITLQALSDSLAVVGELTVKIVDAGVETTTALGVPTLDGLNTAVGTLTKTQGVLYSWFWKAQQVLANIAYTATIGTDVSAEVLPYIKQLSGDDWVISDEVTDYNLAGAKLTYIGPRLDHPTYSSGSRLDNVMIITLTDKCGNVGGDLVITLS